eukprot:517877-Pelagomonas_calceolata.AAC.3
MLSMCWGMPRVWGQKAGWIPAEMGSSGGRPLACLTHSDGWALHQEQVLVVLRGWGGGLENRQILAGKSSNACEGLRVHGCTAWGADFCDQFHNYYP